MQNSLWILRLLEWPRWQSLAMPSTNQKSSIHRLDSLTWKSNLWRDIAHSRDCYTPGQSFYHLANWFHSVNKKNLCPWTATKHAINIHVSVHCVWKKREHLWVVNLIKDWYNILHYISLHDSVKFLACSHESPRTILKKNSRLNMFSSV
jgi:hypothetical protein